MNKFISISLLALSTKTEIYFDTALQCKLKVPFFFPLVGGSLWSWHLPDTCLSLKAIWRIERRLWLHADQQRPLRPVLCHHDQQTPGRSQTAQPGLAVKWSSESHLWQPRGCTKDLSPRRWDRWGHTCRRTQVKSSIRPLRNCRGAGRRGGGERRD